MYFFKQIQKHSSLKEERNCFSKASIVLNLYEDKCLTVMKDISTMIFNHLEITELSKVL